MSKIKFRTLLSLLFDSSIIIHAGNRYISYHSKSREFLPLYNYSFFSYKTGRVFYTVKGSGSPLLLIHDALEGGSGYEWSRVEDTLAQDHTVYTIDLPGCGRSDKYGITYTNFLFVHMISQFIHNVIRDKTSVIACGYSSSIVMMANIYDGSLFKDIILINPSDPETVSKKVSPTGKIYKKIIEIPVYGTMIYNMHSSHEAISSRFMDQYFHNPFHVEHDVLDAFYEGAHKGGYYCKSLYASLASGFMNVNINKAIQRLDANNSRLIFGEKETGKDVIIRRYLKLNPSLSVDICGASRHFPHIESPDQFLALVMK